ncbi:MAG: M90 family metallopeptidase [Spirochaetota bacterium]
MGLLSYFRRLRRRRILAEQPIPDELWDWAMKEHRIFAGLEGSEKEKLRELSTIFLGEKIFDPIGDVDIDDKLRVSVASQSCLPLLGLGIDWYDGWSTIMITPREYSVRKKDYDESGVVHEYEDEFSGEAFDLGPVALSKVDIGQSGWGDGYNVVIHEMAHKLDGRDGGYDGCPPLHREMDPEAWRRVFADAFADFRARLHSPASRKPRRGKLKKSGAPRIDDYAAEGPDEFFAVMCEYFFERPALLRSEYPEVYSQLILFFRRDPLHGL